MDNVLLKHVGQTYTGTAITNIDTSLEEYGYYTVPLAIRNSSYPTEFGLLPSAQVNFALIDDEMPLNLGDKIDYKDYIKIQDANNDIHYIIVNPLTPDQLANDARYSNLRIRENGGILPPENNANQSRTVNLEIPRLSVNTNQFSTEVKKLINTTAQTLNIPVIIPVTLQGNGSYDYTNQSYTAGSSLSFQLIIYENALRDGNHLGAFLV